MYKIIIAGSILVGCIFWLQWGIRRMHAEEREWSKSPFNRKLLRPPGESLRLKIDGIRERIDEQGLIMAMFVILPVFVILSLDFNRSSASSFIVIGCLSAVYLAVSWRKIRELRRELRNYRLGFDGERYVAAELNELMRSGWRIYHDFLVDDKPGSDETNFNIDHIAVSELGVFVIETKAIRKPLKGLADGEDNHRIRVEKGKFILPKGIVNSKPIRQVQTNADWLARWLTGSGRKRIPVVPVVVVPGWFVNDDEKSVRVLNEKQVLNELPKLGFEGALTETEVSWISDKIEDRCRNLEGAK